MDAELNGTFTAGGATFYSKWMTDFGGYSDGGIYPSKLNDKTTPGFLNQYSAMPTTTGNFAVVHYSEYNAQLGANYAVSDNCETPDGIILRSFSMHEMELPRNLLAVSRAGAGVNNIPLTSCAEQGIVVFNTPGANANAVKELVLCALLLAVTAFLVAGMAVRLLMG